MAPRGAFPRRIARPPTIGQLADASAHGQPAACAAPPILLNAEAALTLAVALFVLQAAIAWRGGGTVRGAIGAISAVSATSGGGRKPPLPYH